MKRAALALLVLTASPLVPAPCFCAIQEVVDESGAVTHYKYTDKKGSVVFTDSLAKIPEEYRKQNKIVTIGSPRRRAAATAQVPAEAAPVPATAPPLVLPQAQGETAPAPEDSAGGRLWLIAALVLGAIAVGFVVYRRVSFGNPSLQRLGNRSAGRKPLHHPPETLREPRNAPGEPGQRGTGERNRPKSSTDETLQQLLQARDFGAAARLCESHGDLGGAAVCHLDSGNVARAREIYLELKDYRHAAELAEKAGDGLEAAELYEAAFEQEKSDAPAAAQSDSALQSGRLFEKAGNADRAVGVFLRAGLYSEAAALCERDHKFLQAAESHLRAGNAEQAAECVEKTGNPKHGYAALATLAYDRGLVAAAAEYSEKAGDPMQAATIFQEAKNFAKAGELFSQAGFFVEAAENFSLANDLASAAEAYERAGNYRQAAQAFEAAGADKEKLASLYEKGGDYYRSSRLFVKLGQLDRAVKVAQQVEADSPDYAPASLLIGMILLKNGLTEPASEKFLKIIADQPVSKSNLEPYYFLALCREQAGDAEDARSIFTKILALDYNYRDVRNRVAQK